MYIMDWQKVHVIIVQTNQSHSTPLTDFGILLAQRGLHVTIITTLCNVIQYKPTIYCANSTFNLNIKLLPLDDPRQGDDDEMVLRRSLEKLMEVLVPQPSCIVSANIPRWLHDVIACKFKIPFYAFSPRSCFSYLCSAKIVRNKLHESLDSFFVPDIPHKIKLKASQLTPATSTSTKDMQVSCCRGVLVNSFEELEPWYIGQYKYKRPYINCWGIGPVSLCHKENLNKTNRGQKASVDANMCLNWLGAMKQGSVIYACFGSKSFIAPSQSIEIGLGLESSNRPFIWVIRDDNYSAEIKKWLELTKFEMRVKGRGLVIRGWAPQLVILSHPSVGGYFTHCGWNSTLEGVCAGVPMITWPMFSEQFLNERFVIDVLRIGLKIGVEDMYSSKEVMVKRERVTEAIIELMDGEEAEERRKRAKELGVLANKTLKEGGSSHSNITLFIQDVMQFISRKEAMQKSVQQFISRKEAMQKSVQHNGTT